MHWYLGAFKKYATFSGRASRSEFWFFQLFNVLAIIVLAILDGVIGTMGALTGIYLLASILPSLSVMVRRLHDTGKSGWWYWISATGIGGIVLFIFFVQDTDPAGDKYGVSPKLAMA